MLANCRRFIFENRTKPQILSMFLVLRQTADWIICKANKYTVTKHPIIRRTEMLGCFQCYPFHRHRTSSTRRPIPVPMATISQGHCRAIKFTIKPCTLRPPHQQPIQLTLPHKNSSLVVLQLTKTNKLLTSCTNSRALRCFSLLTSSVASGVEPLSYY